MDGNILLFLLLVGYIMFLLIQMRAFMMLGACDSNRRECVYKFFVWGIIKRICIVSFLILYMDFPILIEILIGCAPTIIAILLAILSSIREALY